MTQDKLTAGYATVYSQEGTTFADDGTEVEVLDLQITLEQADWQAALSDPASAATLIAWLEANRG